MTESAEVKATEDLRARGIWRVAPGLWCDKSVPDFIAVDADCDTALHVLASLERAGQLPKARGEQP